MMSPLASFIAPPQGSPPVFKLHELFNVMKIAILTEYYPDRENPGVGAFVHQRAEGYQAAGHEVRVYRVRSGPTLASSYDGVAVVSADPEAAHTDLRRFRPAVVALHTPYPGLPHTSLAETLQAPRVVWIHGFEAMLTALHGYHRGLDRPLSLIHDIRKLWRLRRSLFGAGAVVYVSNWIRRTAERGMRFRHPRTQVIPNPVDLERFQPSDRPRTGGRLTGLVFRPLSTIHGLDIAVAAYAGLRETELTIVGVGPDADSLRAQIDQSKAPVSLEERGVKHSEVPALLAAHDYFVSPERKTPTQGVAMCEAMACGLPVIAVRAGGVPEYVRDGTDGFLFRSGKPSALRRAVLALVSEPERARRMGHRAREYVAERCSAAEVIPAELALLAELAG